ncbi:MAG: phenylalanine--tRNA ligase subunit alpha [Promethearchaeota archaeon]
MSGSVTEKEQKLLSLLNTKSKAIPPSLIAQELALNQETIRSLIESLVQKKFIKRQETSVHQIYQLTSEAQRFGREGLPEVRLVNLLERLGRKASMKTIEGKPELRPDELRLALGWAKRNGWVTIEKREGQTWLTLVKDAMTLVQDYPLQKALHAAHSFGELQEEQLGNTPIIRKRVRRDLIQRGLVNPQKQVTIEIQITPKGKQALEKAQSRAAQIGDLTPELLQSGEWLERPFRPYNIRGPTPRLYPGKKNPYAEFIDRVKRILIGLGFQEAKGPLVELEFWNCDALFMPQDHVAREVHDIYHIKAPKGPGRIAYPLLLQQVAQTHEDGWTTDSTGWGYKYSIDIAKHLVLRSQTTAVSIRYLAEHKEAPLRMFCIDLNFRPEKFDATHSAEFLQCEGIIGGEGLTFRDLLGYLRAIAEGVGIEKIKFKPGFFPFTEPSVEGSIYMPGLGWLEALPGGIFRPEVTKPLGIDFPVLAWGIGIDRLAMAALGIQDIRELATRNLGNLRKASLRF